MKEIDRLMESISLHQKIIVPMHVLLLLDLSSITNTQKVILEHAIMVELYLWIKFKLSAKKELSKHLI